MTPPKQTRLPGRIEFDLDLLRSISIPGISPPKQARSQLRVQLLLGVALELLKKRDFDTIGVDELCEKAGISIGPFYARFEGKEVFFQYLQRVVVEHTFERSKVALERTQRGTPTLSGFFDQIVGNALRWYQEYEGLIRASLRRSQTQPDAWEPLRELGARQSELIQEGALKILGQPPSSLLLETISFAVQSMIGTFNNMVLVNSAPLSIRHPRTKELMVTAMVLQIENISRATDKHP